jgi:hypothetical protein
VLFVYLVDNSCHFLNWENIYILVVNPEFINVMICHALKFFLPLWSSLLCMCVCLYIYIYIYIERERERERDFKLISSQSKKDNTNKFTL